MRTRFRFGAMLIFVVVVLLGAQHARCGEVTYQTWLDYNPTWQTGSNVSVFGDAGIRRSYQDPRWWKCVLRPSLGYDLGGWHAAAGLGNFYTNFAGVAHLYELRPWQGLRLRWPSSPVTLSHLLRLEERFFFDTDDENSVFRFRFRYQIETRVTWATSERGSGWSSPLSIEAFLEYDKEAEERFGEQLRLTGGIERVLGPQLRLRADILWQKTEGLLDLNGRNEFYFRFRVFQYL